MASSSRSAAAVSDWPTGRCAAEGAPERPRPVGIPADLMAAVESARAHAPELLALPNVVAVRGGYKFVDDWITRTPAVVVAVDRNVDGLPAREQVPRVLSDGMPTDVTVADPIERLTGTAGPEAVSAVRRVREPLDRPDPGRRVGRRGRGGGAGHHLRAAYRCRPRSGHRRDDGHVPRVAGGRLAGPPALHRGHP